MTDPNTLVVGLARLGKVVAEIAGSSDAAKRNALLIEFQQALIKTQGITASEQIKNASLVARNQELEQEILRLKDWAAERANYTLQQIFTGIFAYIKNDNMEQLETAHKFCSHCFDERNCKSILQLQVINPGRRKTLVCHGRKSSLELLHNAFVDQHI